MPRKTIIQSDAEDSDEHFEGNLVISHSFDLEKVSLTLLNSIYVYQKVSHLTCHRHCTSSFLIYADTFAEAEDEEEFFGQSLTRKRVVHDEGST